MFQNVCGAAGAQAASVAGLMVMLLQQEFVNAIEDGLRKSRGCHRHGHDKFRDHGAQVLDLGRGRLFGSMCLLQSKLRNRELFLEVLEVCVCVCVSELAGLDTGFLPYQSSC